MTSFTLITSLKAPPPNSHILKPCDFYLSTRWGHDSAQHKLSPSELNVVSSPSVHLAHPRAVDCPTSQALSPLTGDATRFPTE